MRCASHFLSAAKQLASPGRKGRSVGVLACELGRRPAATGQWAPRKRSGLELAAEDGRATWPLWLGEGVFPAEPELCKKWDAHRNASVTAGIEGEACHSAARHGAPLGRKTLAAFCLGAALRACPGLISIAPSERVGAAYQVSIGGGRTSLGKVCVESSRGGVYAIQE